MNAKDVIRLTLKGSEMVCQSYLGDLTDADLLVRPAAGSNHIAWQLGHLIAAEHGLMEAICPGTMPALPLGFEEKYNNETAKLDTPGAFHTKAELLAAAQAQRAGTLAQLEKVPDADLDKPVPEKFRSFVSNVGDMFNLQGTHWLMHAGQWAVVRRKLGRPPLF